MGKKYVVNGATLKCVLGAAPSTLTVLPVNRVEINGKAKANIMAICYCGGGIIKIQKDGQ